ncbi:MAG: CooT family nickel-binding protein [Deltaproteobacteria bacterium]|nr:CooT family nickel-binding protein [Deltaproteobacteria bacterium]MBW2136244.1 CooT family nickel-binding protein [Deltaproteobacteria bacterium]
MCESSVYLLKGGREELVLENVDRLESKEDHVRIKDMFGEEKIVKARVKSLSLLDHKILLEAL